MWGEAFEQLYTQYEEEGRARKVVRAQQLWFAVLEAQIETGNPYMLYKDSCNRKSNQQNLGTIKCSNLCTGEEEEQGRGGWVLGTQVLVFGMLLHTHTCSPASVSVLAACPHQTVSLTEEGVPLNAAAAASSFPTTEIIEYTSPDETAVCNLASIALPRFVREKSQQVRRQAGQAGHMYICGLEDGRLERLD